jgi:hypothetical protein
LAAYDRCTPSQVDGQRETRAPWPVAQPAFGFLIRVVQLIARLAATEVREGIPMAGITVAGGGESQPLVQTADGVSELWNRRVEIVLQEARSQARRSRKQPGRFSLPSRRIREQSCSPVPQWWRLWHGLSWRLAEQGLYC